MKTTIIFDLDGTLLNTLDDLMTSTNHALTSFGYPTRTYEEIRAFVGNGISLLVERALPDSKRTEDFDEVFAAFKEHYSAHSLDRTRPYDGIDGMLRHAKELGYKTAIVSNKFDAGVKSLKKTFFDGVIDTAYGESEGVRPKPAPDTVFMAMKELGVSAEECVYVGDSDVDVMTAKNSGLDAICVLWGFRDRELLASLGATHFITEPNQIFDILKSL